MASSSFVDNTTIHHCEVICDDAHGANSNYTNCKTNPGHRNFLTVAEFGIEHLPSELRDTRCMEDIQNHIQRTVKITVTSTSRNRPDTYPDCQIPYPYSNYKGNNSFSRCGTGFLSYYPLYGEENCPCPECKQSDDPRMGYWGFIVETATHVVFDDLEAQSVVVDLFYDTEDRQGVKHLYGLQVSKRALDEYRTDALDVICITHEKELAKMLQRISIVTNDFIQNGYGIMISHPHGVSKRISLGRFYQQHFITRAEPRVKPFSLCKATKVYIPPSDDSLDDTLPIGLSKHKQTTMHQIKLKDDQHFDMHKETSDPQSQLVHVSIDDYLDQAEEKDIYTLKDCVDFDFPRLTEIISPYENNNYIPTGWYNFTSDTRCVSPSGISFDVKKGTKFLWESEQTCWLPTDNPLLNLPPWYISYVTYDMASCPGSSGAKVKKWRHFGSFDQGKNRSGHWMREPLPEEINFPYPKTGPKADIRISIFHILKRFTVLVIFQFIPWLLWHNAILY